MKDSAIEEFGFNVLEDILGDNFAVCLVCPKPTSPGSGTTYWIREIG
jgi:hypothetical protein